MIPNPTHPVLDGSRHGRLFGCVVSIITFAMIHDSRPLPAMEGSAWVTPYLYMERKYQMTIELADAVQNRIQEEDLQIKIHFGKEVVDCHGDRQVDVLLEYDDPNLVNVVLTDTINITYNLV